MNIWTVILTKNRPHLLARCLASLSFHQPEHRLLIVDNGSDDPKTRELLVDARSLGAITLRTREDERTIGRAKTIGIEEALKQGAEMILSSDDDYVYKSQALQVAWDFLHSCPPDVAVLGAYVEPLFPWSLPRDIINAGGLTAVVRDTVPGGGWFFMNFTARKFLPFADQTSGEDVDACHRLAAMGLRTCAMDLAENAGERESLIKNQAWRIARPFDKVRWRV